MASERTHLGLSTSPSPWLTAAAVTAVWQGPCFQAAPHVCARACIDKDIMLPEVGTKTPPTTPGSHHKPLWGSVAGKGMS